MDTKMFISFMVITLFSCCNANVVYLVTHVLEMWCVGFYSIWSSPLHFLFLIWCYICSLLVLKNGPWCY